MIPRQRAVELAVAALQYICKRRYTSGEEAYRKGVDLDFATRGHAHYTEIQEAIAALLALVEEPKQAA